MPEKRTTVSEAEEIELELKRLQIDQMREQIRDRNERKEQFVEKRRRLAADLKKDEQERLRRQRVCKHRKGGRDNRFSNGSDNNYSVFTNTYPTGAICISCTRCGKEVWKPDAKLKKANPELYAEMLAEFKKWAEFPTDNTPSGSKIFEISAA